MKWERRHSTNSDTPSPASLGSDLPLDYLRLVETTLTSALEAGLNEIKKIHATSDFKAFGSIFGDEVVLAISLTHGTENLAATTVYASANFNPNADQPGLEATLSALVDAAGSVFDYYLDPASPERVAQIADRSLGALEEAPFEWTAVAHEIAEKVPVWVKIDKTNPVLETLAEDWLKKNDPGYSADDSDAGEAETFLEERLDAIKKASSGHSGPGGMSGGGSGPITH